MVGHISDALLAYVQELISLCFASWSNTPKQQYACCQWCKHFQLCTLDLLIDLDWMQIIDPICNFDLLTYVQAAEVAQKSDVGEEGRKAANLSQVSDTFAFARYIWPNILHAHDSNHLEWNVVRDMLLSLLVWEVLSMQQYCNTSNRDLNDMWYRYQVTRLHRQPKITHHAIASPTKPTYRHSSIE